MERVIEGFRLSPQQRRLWPSAQLGTAYRAQCAVMLRGELDAPALRHAADLVAARHEILRTTFHSTASMDVPIQVVDDDALLDWGETDLGGLSAAEQSARVEQLFLEEGASPFDYRRGPLFRLRLLRLSNETHVLLLNLPALCADARTLDNIVSQIAAAYGAPAAAADDPTEVVQYVQFSEWQNDLSDSERAREISLREQEALATECELSFLFEARPNPPAVFRPASIGVTLPPRQAERIERLARRSHASPEAFLFCCWHILLRRFAGKKEIQLGYRADGRKYEELADSLGLFARVIPVEQNPRERQVFSDALAQAAEVIRDAQSSQEYYGSDLHAFAADAPPPFHAVTFEYLERTTTPRAHGVQFSVEKQHCCTDRFKLKLSCVRDAETLRLDCFYDADLFDAESIRRLLRCYEVLVESAVNGPDVQVGRLDILSDRDRSRLLFDYNQTAANQSEGVPVHQLFEQQAAQHPERVALVYGGRRLTYSELDARANRLARLLRARRVGAEARVALLFERSPEMVVALLGVLKAGAAYVPLDPALPAARLAFMLEDSGAALLLTGNALAGVLPVGGGREALAVDGEAGRSLLAEFETAAPGVEVDERSAAYVIYTSGSTGRPKGVVVEHAQLARYVAAFAARIGLEHGASFAMLQSFAVDLGHSALYPSLASGGTLHLIEPALAADAAALADYMTRHAVGLLKIAPSHLRALGREGGAGLLPRRWLVVGGEASERGWLRRVREQAGRCRVFNHYGPTETTVGVLMHEVAADDEGAGGDGAGGAAGEGAAGGRTVPAGRPLAGTRCYVLDGRMGPVPEGVCGELYVGGRQVARGYGGAARQTAERFVPDGYGGEAGARLYRTGDVVRRLAGGEIEFVGRADEQVKVRGYRVELGEIESVLRAHPAVVAACAVVREVARGDGQLVAYVVPDINQPPSAEQLRGYLQERLPQYMLPSFIVRMDALPLTRSGKVDKLSLPAPEAGRSGVDAPMVFPRTLEEELLAGILADVLRVELVGIHDNFFALGGDSMRSIQVLARARQKGLDVTNEQLFQHQTVAKLAQEVRFSQSAMPPPEQTEPFSLISEADRRRVPDDVEDAYPLAQLQAGMIFHSELNPDSAIYHDLHSYQLRVPLDPAALREAVHHVVNRHAVLRTSFDLSSYSEPLQLVHKSVAPPVTFEDLRHLTPAGQEEAISRWQEAEKRRRHEWGRPPLLRVHVHVRSEESFQFTLSYHHAILDGWSSAAMQTELFNLYTALREDPERAAAAPPPPPVSYSRFVALEQQALKSEESRTYWARQLAEPTVARLPASAPDAPTDLPPVEVHNVPLPPEVVEGIFGLARASSVPLKSVLLAAHLKVVSIVGGVSDVLTGAVTNGRPDEPDADQVLGLFLNTVPFRMRLKGGTWDELIQRAFEAERDMLPFRRFPLAELQRLHGGQPLFDAVFNFVSFHVFESVSSLGGGLQVLGYKGYNELNFPLTVTFQLVPGPQLYLDLIYRPGQLEPRQAQLIGHYFARTLADMARDPRARYETADVLREEEKRQLREWNETRVAYPRVELAHELFEAQAARTPRAVAAVAAAGQLTYEELDARANRLARHLRKRGVGPDVAVGLLVERSPEMLVGLFGVLKAGGAYVPLDPAYPKQRLAFMARDADMPVLLTQSHLVADLPEFRGEVIRLDGDWEEISREPAGPLPRSGFAENLCYVIYTSGSTGQPKGISLSHGALTNLVQWHQETLLGGARTLQFASLSFDASFHEIFAALSTGGQVFLISEAQRRDIAALGRYIGEHRVEKVILPVTVLQQLAEEYPDGGDAPLQSMREVTTTGEQMKITRPIVSLFERLTDCRVHNHYGPAETHVVTAYTLGDEPQAWPSHPPIGRPIANTTMHVLDAHLQLVPPGVTGELYIGGVGLARGYHNRPGVTAEKFIPDPFSGEPGARLYRSGDLGRYLPDGNIVYAGRVDHMVKIRGQRVELAEIEAALSEHPAVDETVVLAADDGAGQKRLVAYVVPNGGPQVSVSDLHAFLKDRLPVYMLPSAFVMLDSFPLNANGKVDRRALPAPDHSRPELDASYVAPRTAAEELVAGIWSRVLKIEKVGLGDNFFELGGHSLLATQLVSRVRQTFRVDLPLPALYDKPTVEGMLEAVSAAWGGREIVEEIAHTLRQIEALSEEEVQAEISKALSG